MTPFPLAAEDTRIVPTTSVMGAAEQGVRSCIEQFQEPDRQKFSVLEDDALRMAREADEKIAAGESVGRLHGVPITVKEGFDVVGSATTHGIVALKDSMSQTDAPVVAHLKQAGAIPIGRTNLPDYGLRYHTSWLDRVFSHERETTPSPLAVECHRFG